MIIGFIVLYKNTNVFKTAKVIYKKCAKIKDNGCNDIKEPGVGPHTNCGANRPHTFCGKQPKIIVRYEENDPKN